MLIILYNKPMLRNRKAQINPCFFCYFHFPPRTIKRHPPPTIHHSPDKPARTKQPSIRRRMPQSSYPPPPLAVDDPLGVFLRRTEVALAPAAEPNLLDQPGVPLLRGNARMLEVTIRRTARSAGVPRTDRTARACRVRTKSRVRSSRIRRRRLPSCGGPRHSRKCGRSETTCPSRECS